MQNASLPDDIVAAFAAEQSEMRVFSLMGPNGSGKSKLLLQTWGHLRREGIPCLLLPSSRDLGKFSQTLNNRVLPTPLSEEEANDPDAQWWHLVQKLFDPKPQPFPPVVLPTFPDVLGHLLWRFALDQRRKAERFLDEHADYKAGRRDTQPAPPDTSALGDLEAKIEDVLKYPTRIKRVDVQTGQQEQLMISFTRDGGEFGPDGLSDGEKQILLLSIFLVNNKTERLVFLVDEPELYFNEALAIEIWQRLENNFPKAVFAYATHNPSFATRSGVHRPYVMRRNGTVESLDTSTPVPPQILREIVGTRVQLLRTDANPIFCEDALAKHIMDDLMAGEKVVTVPLHNRDTVINAVRKEQGWHLLRSEGPKHCGVIDRDTADDEEVGKLEQMGVFCFPRYEAETLLLDPTVATWAIALAGPKLSRVQYAELLVKCGTVRRDLMLHKVAVHVSRQQRYEPLRFTPGPEGVSNIRINSSDALVSRFDQRAVALYKALKDKDADAILTLFKGKCLYSTMQGLLQKEHGYDLPEPEQWYLQLRASKAFEATMSKVSWLSAFRTKVKDFLAC